LVVSQQFFKTSRSSKTKTVLAKTKTSKNSLKTKTGLKDDIAASNYTTKLNTHPTFTAYSTLNLLHNADQVQTTFAYPCQILVYQTYGFTPLLQNP